MRLPFKLPVERPKLPGRVQRVFTNSVNGRGLTSRLINWFPTINRTNLAVAVLGLLLWSAAVFVLSGLAIASPQGQEISIPNQVMATKLGPAALPASGEDRVADIEDVLLLYNSSRKTDFDTSFCKLAEYYGLLCKRIAIDTTELTDELLRDPQGDHFKLIGIAGANLFRDDALLTSESLSVLQTAIDKQGVELLISKLGEDQNFALLYQLTDGNVLEAVKPVDDFRDWFVSTAAPEITREFTGQMIAAEEDMPQDDLALVLDAGAPVMTLVTSRDNRGYNYPIFVRYKRQSGAIWVDAGSSGSDLDARPLRHAYYAPSEFSKVLPIMFALRYVLGEETWHNNQDYANLTIDDPALTEPYDYHLSFVKLLPQMKQHNFHTTISMHPRTWEESQPQVVDLFVENPEYFSLAQHGNNGDGYEFYKYTVSEDDEYNGTKLPARPFEEQRADVIEGLQRMIKHEELTGIPFDKIMIFPWGIAPQRTLELLKQLDYLGTVNAQNTPLGETTSLRWTFGMYPADLNYGSFPLLTRRRPGNYEPFQPHTQPFIFDLFVDKPVLFYTHVHELFVEGIHAFNEVADETNNLYGEVEWRSLGYILRHLYLEKTNDDGSVDVQMYSNHLILANESEEEKTYHLTKLEHLNVPIAAVTVDGEKVPYHVENGSLKLVLNLAAHSTREIIVNYGE
jgi:hypothetical protein